MILVVIFHNSLSRFLVGPEGSIGHTLACSVGTENEIHANLKTDTGTQSSEPILFLKVRMQVADFPYLLCCADQMLPTLET